MSKFIRTENGIFDTNKLNLNKIIGNIKYEIIDTTLFKTMYGYEAHLYEYEIINQADTIEELCDLFVYNNPGGNTIFEKISEGEDEDEVAILTKPLSRDINLYGQGIGKEQIERGVYGCIWTSKGLIYVAKLNDKGELELI